MSTPIRKLIETAYGSAHVASDITERLNREPTPEDIGWLLKESVYLHAAAQELFNRRIGLQPKEITRA